MPRATRPAKRPNPRCPRPNGLGKECFRSAAKARRAIVKTRGKTRHALYVYQCRHCGLWHITHAPRRDGGAS